MPPIRGPIRMSASPSAGATQRSTLRKLAPARASSLTANGCVSSPQNRSSTVSLSGPRSRPLHRQRCRGVGTEIVVATWGRRCRRQARRRRHVGQGGCSGEAWTSRHGSEVDLDRFWRTRWADHGTTTLLSPGGIASGRLVSPAAASAAAVTPQRSLLITAPSGVVIARSRTCWA